MNYRHAYHAGNFADVFKHIVLMLVLEHLRQKDKPFFVLDTHAGIGKYDLQSIEAQKTGEAGEGIGRLWGRYDESPEPVKHYLDLIRSFNSDGTLRTYPGSPAIIQSMLRANDRLIANELHPEDVKTLRRNLGPDKRVRGEQMDAYQTLKAFLPPPERRGLVLIDPPFEVENEFDFILKGLKEAQKRWPTGIFMIWYPVKETDPIEKFEQTLCSCGFKEVPLIIRYDLNGKEGTLRGCGFAIFNPPWTLRAEYSHVYKFFS